MGTNYYIKTKKCPTCGHKPEGLHIGKSSAGWKFLFQLYRDFYSNIETLKKFLKGKQIENEYDEPISKKQFWKMVEYKQKITDPVSEQDIMKIDGYSFYDREFS